MPKVVDHEERRREIVQATMRVISRIGLDHTTIKEIAKEAGYSNGVLAHYFTNKEHILIMAHRTAFEAAGKRIKEKAQGLGSIDEMREALYEALPLDEERNLEAHIDVSFWAHAIIDPKLQHVRAESYKGSQARWVGLLEILRSNGIVRTSASNADLAHEIGMIVDALSVEALLFPEIVTVERQKHVVERFLERIQSDN